jgi:hypothetical protein
MITSFTSYWELIFSACLFFVGILVYAVATNDRGSFADTPDWSKVVRRITELFCVFIGMLLLIFIGWSDIISNILMIAFSIIGAFVAPSVIVRKRAKGNPKNQQKNEQLNEYLVNAIILTLFMLSGMLVVLITAAKFLEQPAIAHCLLLILSLLLSTECSILFFQLHYLVLSRDLPDKEIIQIVRISKELNG